MITEGQSVWLLPFEEEPRQAATVVGITEMPWGQSIMVELDEEYREDESDDGLREVTIDQIEQP